MSHESKHSGSEVTSTRNTHTLTDLTEGRLICANLNASRFPALRFGKHNFQYAIIDFGCDPVVIHFVAEDERTQKVADVILLMQQSRRGRSIILHTTKQRQLVV